MASLKVLMLNINIYIFVFVFYIGCCKAGWAKKKKVVVTPSTNFTLDGVIFVRAN